MTKVFRRARRLSGLAKFERQCGVAREGGRCRKAWRVPGTREAGQWSMLASETQRIAYAIVAGHAQYGELKLRS